MKKAPTEREALLKKHIKKLESDIFKLFEANKLLEKRLDFMQDQVAAFAIQERAMIQGVKLILDIANKIAEKHLKKGEQPAGIQ